MRESFVFYKSFYDGIKEMPIATQAEIYSSIMEYVFTGNEVELKTPISRALFTLIKPQLDANTKRYENGKKGAKFGKLGGRPKKETSEKLLKSDEDETEISIDENANVNESINNNINVNAEKSKTTHFKPPTIPELIELLEGLGESNATPMANNFYNFYQSKGWVVGKVKMKDWRASAKLWQKREFSNLKKPEYKHPASNYQNNKPLNPNF